MIKEIKDIAEQAVNAACPGQVERIVRTVDEEIAALSGSFAAVVALISKKDGLFDESKRKEYEMAIGGKKRQVVLRGERCIPLIVRVTARNENDADRLLSAIIAAFPLRYTQPLLLGGVSSTVDGHIRIVSEEHSDGIPNLQHKYVSAFVAEFTQPVIARVSDAVVFFNSTVEPEPKTNK